MRRLISLGFVVVAMVAALVTVPLAWVAHNVAYEDGYVAFTTPLGSDPELQRGLAGYLGEYLVQQQGLPASLQPVATVVLEQAASRTANAPGFTKAWQETQRSSHRLIFGSGANEDRLAIDLGPLSAFVVEHATAKLPFKLSAPDHIVLKINGAPEHEAIKQVEATPDNSRKGLLVIGVAALASLLFAKRRSTGLAVLGIGAVGVAAALRVVSTRAVPDILDSTGGPSSFARTLQKLLADRASDSLSGWLTWITIGGVAMIVVGIFGRLARSRT